MIGNAGKVVTSANVPLVILNVLYRWHPEWNNNNLDEQTFYCLLLTNIFAFFIVLTSTVGQWAVTKLAEEQRELKGQLAELCLMLLAKLA